MVDPLKVNHSTKGKLTNGCPLDSTVCPLRSYPFIDITSIKINNMSGPKHQHFIPQSYLKNFATQDGDKFFVESMNVHSGKIRKQHSTKDICVKKNLYTIPKAKNDEKYALEKYYADNIDAIYPDVYKLLNDESIIHITEEQREKILSTTLSFYFRTARFLQEKNEELNGMFNRIIELDSGEEANLYITYGGKRYDFNLANLEETRENAKIDNKLNFLINHVKDWSDFINHKKHSQITVLKVEGEVPLITCDNPVDIYNDDEGKPFNVFDPENSIQLPLNKPTYLWISHNDEECDRHTIYRRTVNKWFALTSNSTVQKNASDWLIGAEGTINIHQQQLAIHNEETPDNIQALEDIITLSLGLSEFVSFAEKNGGVTSELSLSRLNELLKIPAFQNDKTFMHFSSQVLDIASKMKK